MTARIRYELSRTINTGKFESVKVQIGLEMECEQTKEDVEKAFRRCKSFVDGRLEEEEAKWRL